LERAFLCIALILYSPLPPGQVCPCGQQARQQPAPQYQYVPQYRTDGKLYGALSFCPIGMFASPEENDPKVWFHVT
jgi:hypothetical protein